MNERLSNMLERAQARLLELGTVETLLLRIELGDADVSDECDAVCDAIADGQRADGSWHGSMAATAEYLLILSSLRAAHVRPAAERACEWITERRNLAGAFPGRCTPALHEMRLCSHSISGFFAPAPATVDLSTLGFATLAGVAGSDQDARIAASALACVGLLEWGVPAASVTDHIDGAVRLTECIAGSAFPASMGAVAVLLRLSLATSDAAWSGRIVDHIVRTQRGDGSWRGVDLFAMLELLASAAQRGRTSDSLMAALQRSGEMLRLMQQPDEVWGRGTSPQRLLAGWRALRVLTTGPDSAGAARLATVTV